MVCSPLQNGPKKKKVQKMVQKMVQKIVQKIVQPIFYPMPAPPVPVAFTTEYKGIFSLLDRVVLFPSSLGLLLFFFFFSPRTFFRFLFFHEQRFFHKQGASTCGFCQVRDVNKIRK